MVKCHGGHTLVASTVSVSRPVECDSCDSELEAGSNVFQCGPCEFDLCELCFKQGEKTQEKKETKPKNKLVKLGFLKPKITKVSTEAPSSASASGSAMGVDTKGYFAFSGFPADSDPKVICDLMRERIHDFLSEFSVSVIGFCIHDGSAHVGIEFLVSERPTLENKIFDLRDTWIFEGKFLNAVHVEIPAAFTDPGHAPVQEPVHVSAPTAPRAASMPPVPRAPVGPPPFHVSPNRRVVQRVFEQVSPPSLPQVPALPEGGDSFQATVLASLDQISAFMTTQLVTRDHLETYHQEQLKVITSRVDQAVAPLHGEIQELRGRIETLEAGSSRIRSASERPRGTDPAFKRIVFKKIPESMSAEQRIKEIEGFMQTHFQGVRIRDVANFYKGKFPNGRTLTRAAFVELSNSDVRREVLSKIGGTKNTPVKIKCELGGKQVDIKGAMTDDAVQRNASLRRAADLIKADARATGKDVKIEFTGERGVTVNKVFGFSQAQNELTGKFVGAFTDLRLP